MKKIVCFGEILVDFIAHGTYGSLVRARKFTKFLGGAPANTASALGRLGDDVALMGAVGADHLGEFIKKELEAKGVDTRPVQIVKGRPTAVVFVSLDSGGEPRFHSFGDGVAYNYFKTNMGALGLMAKFRAIHFTSIPLIQSAYRKETMKALRSARKNGLILSFDPNIRIHLFKSQAQARKVVKKVLPLAHILKLGEEEFRFLFGNERPEITCPRLAGEGAKLVLITAGKNGARFYFKGSMGRVRPFPVKAVDATGAGDAFMAGVLSRVADLSALDRISIKDMREIVRFASAVAAISTTRPGAVTALPSVRQVERFLGHTDR